MIRQYKVKKKYLRSNLKNVDERKYINKKKRKLFFFLIDKI